MLLPTLMVMLLLLLTAGAPHAAFYTAPNLAPYASSYTVKGAALGGVPAALPVAALPAAGVIPAGGYAAGIVPAAGLVGYANGAVVPAEPAAVVAARADHLAALSAAY